MLKTSDVLETTDEGQSKQFHHKKDRSSSNMNEIHIFGLIFDKSIDSIYFGKTSEHSAISIM